MALGLLLIASALALGIAARVTYDTVAARIPGGRPNLEFSLVLGGVTFLAAAVLVLIAVVSSHWHFIVAILAIAAALALGATWRQSFPVIGRGLLHPRVLRPLVIGGVALAAIWLFSASLPFRAVVLWLAFLAYVVWLGINLIKPHRLTKKKD